MAFRFLVLCATLAFANAGNILAPAALSYAAAPALAYGTPLSYSAPAITSQSSNIYRSAGNLGQISTYSKSIDTPFSSVRKADVRISNPGLSIAAAPAYAYSAPAYAAPTAYSAYAAPTAYTAHSAYAAPTAYTAHSAYAAPTAYAAHAAYAAPTAHAPLLGVAYSAAPAVAHVAFDSGVAHYAW